MRVRSVAPVATAWIEALPATGCLVSETDPAADVVLAPVGADFDGAGVPVERVASETFKQALDARLRVGRLLDRLDAVMRLIADGERQLRLLHRRLEHLDGPEERLYASVLLLAQALFPGMIVG